MGCKIVGLVKDSHLNGKFAKINYWWYHPDEIYEVDLPGYDSTMMIQPKNMRLFNLDRGSMEPFKLSDSPVYPVPKDPKWLEAQSVNVEKLMQGSSIEGLVSVHNSLRPEEFLTPQLSLLSSLIPVAVEFYDRENECQVFDWVDSTPEVGRIKKLKPGETARPRPPNEPISQETSIENKVLWENSMPPIVQDVMNQLLRRGVLTWADILADDHNVLWEICLTNTPEFIEPDRWNKTVCNFMLLLAYERTYTQTKKLYPTVRLQVLRDLFVREWRHRSRRLGNDVYHLVERYRHPDELDMRVKVSEQYSEYERARNDQVLKNQAMLKQLGLDQLVNEKPAPAPRATRKQPADKKAPACATRCSPRIKKPPPGAPSCSADRFSDDDDSSDDDDGATSDYDDSGSESESDAPLHFDASDTDLEEEQDKPDGKKAAAKKTGGKQRALKKVSGSANDVATSDQPKSAKSKSASGAVFRVKTYTALRISGGAPDVTAAIAEVPPLPRGDMCPDPLYEKACATQHAALAQARKAHGIEHGVASEPMRGVFDRCCKTFDSADSRADFSTHSLPPPKGYMCPQPDCDAAFRTEQAAWEHAKLAHGIEHDPMQCLFDRCGAVSKNTAAADVHAKEHTKERYYALLHCQNCGDGHNRVDWARVCCAVTECSCGVPAWHGYHGPRARASYQCLSHLSSPPLIPTALH